MRQRLWSAICRAARWYAQGFGAALAHFGHAELVHLPSGEVPQDIGAYARAGVAELEAWLGRSTVTD